MVVDTSVVLQILFDEPGAVEALRVIANAADPVVTAPGVLEAEIVYGSRARFGDRAVSELIERMNLRVEDFSARHVPEARLAYERFGWGSGSPARLNFGDCVSYAVARDLGRPLAFKGDDFGHTDLRVVRTG